ncbi:hypothetical protein PG999_007457 [Apiospora kogelbergensis]|uniref:Uncharacterized protein n=1 Tax=Apiospora kogelbergensis TaxID=1337665 RepID=A0AAW0QYE2_9PEZI
MTQHAFVQQVAYLEGLQSITPPKEALPVTLENIHARLIQLERVHRQPQPPTIVPDWESLRYRTVRLWRDMGSPMAVQWLNVTCDKWWPSAGDTGDGTTAVALERTLRSLGIISFSAALHARDGEAAGTDHGGPSSSSSSSSSANQFDIAAQEFCHLAGKKSRKPNSPFRDVRELYAAAIELSLNLEARLGYPGGPPGVMRPGGLPPMSRFPPPPPPPGRKTKSCCGCCSCKCHEKKKGGLARFLLCGARSSNDSDSDSDSDSDVGSSRRQRKGWRRFVPSWGWLSKGRKKRRSGYGSDTSSSTIVD